MVVSPTVTSMERVPSRIKLDLVRVGWECDPRRRPVSVPAFFARTQNKTALIGGGAKFGGRRKARDIYRNVNNTGLTTLLTAALASVLRPTAILSFYCP